MKGCEFDLRWKSSQKSLWWVKGSPMMLTWKFESWDNIKFEVYTICRISFPMVLKICWKKMYDRNLSTRLSQVKISYGGWKGLLWYWLGWKFQKKSIFQNVNISDLAFSRVEQVILLYKGAKNSHWGGLVRIPFHASELSTIGNLARGIRICGQNGAISTK